MLPSPFESIVTTVLKGRAFRRAVTSPHCDAALAAEGKLGRNRDSEGSAVGGQRRSSGSGMTIAFFCLFGLLILSIHSHAADPADKRFQWSEAQFAVQCGYKTADYSKAEMKWFTDRNYSDKWTAISASKLKACEDCYRFAEVASVGKLRVVRLSLDSESRDWLHEIHYCFEENGSLRAVQSVFNCAWGWSYVRLFSFENGSLKALASRWQELKSGKEIVQPKTASDLKDHWDDVPMYKAFSNVPFAKLISTNAQTN